MPVDTDKPPLPKGANANGDDLPPRGEEARAQRRETVMPLVWLGLGLLVVIVFVAVLAMRSDYRPFPQAAPPAMQAPSTLAPPVPVKPR